MKPLLLDPPLVLTALSAGAAAIGLLWAARTPLRVWHRRHVDQCTRTLDQVSAPAITPRRLAFAWYLGAAAVTLALLLLAPSAWICTAGVPLAWVARTGVVRWMRRRRRDAIQRQLPDTIRAISDAISAGCTLPVAIASAVERAPEPMRSELSTLLGHYRLGTSMADAIRSAQQRLACQDFDLFAAALLVSLEMGGDICPTLKRIATAIESIQLMRSKVRASTTAGRTNILVLSLTPPVFLLLDYVIDPQAVALMFRSVLGWTILGGACTLCVLAVSWARRIIRVDI